ncbi:MAG: chloride channel protein [bacterium]|nr:chloride channel protein [bacterium]
MADEAPNLQLWKRMVGLLNRAGLRDDWYLIALGAIIGTITAFGAIGFKTALDHTAETTFEFVGHLPLWLLPLAPIAGALVTAVLIHFFAPEAKGHGVPEVIDAVYRRGGKIRKRVAVIKALASITTIGSGGSAGAEGPIVQIGSAIGSGIAGFLRIDRDQVPTLLGCGAAAGIASVFNAPIAGVFFCLEILLRDFSLKTFTPIVVASVISTATTQAWFGENKAIFAVTGELSEYQFTYAELPSYLLLGLVCGAVAVGFIRMLYASEDLADRVKLHPIAKPMLGALLLGVLGIGYLLFARTQGVEAQIPNFFGNGYETIEALLEPSTFGFGSASEAGLSNPLMPGEIVSTSLLMLALLLICKILATCLTLGSGGSGGVFAPSLFLGAAAGALFGELLSLAGLLPDGGSPAAYALVGMAAVVAGTTHAPLTAIADYQRVFPAAFAFSARRAAMIMPSRYRALPNPGYDDVLWTTALRRCEASAQEHAGAALISQVIEALHDSLEHPWGGRTPPTLAEMAAHLHVSLSTLNRRLRGAATSYQALVDDVRRQRARELLANPRQRVGDIAAALGFLDPTSFVRSFRRWYGTTPGRYRRELAAGRR